MSGLKDGREIIVDISQDSNLEPWDFEETAEPLEPRSFWSVMIHIYWAIIDESQSVRILLKTFLQ
jgi:hypothetical protein